MQVIVLGIRKTITNFFYRECWVIVIIIVNDRSLEVIYSRETYDEAI